MINEFDINFIQDIKNDTVTYFWRIRKLFLLLCKSVLFIVLSWRYKNRCQKRWNFIVTIEKKIFSFLLLKCSIWHKKKHLIFLEKPFSSVIKISFLIFSTRSSYFCLLKSSVTFPVKKSLFLPSTELCYSFQIVTLSSSPKRSMIEWATLYVWERNLENYWNCKWKDNAGLYLSCIILHLFNLSIDITESE